MKNNCSFLFTLLFILININSFSQNKHNICVTDEYNNALEKNDSQRIEEINLKKISFDNWKVTKSYTTEKTIVIPVVFHIVHNGEQLGSQENPYESKILEQLQILNDIYANKNNNGVDTKVKFCLAERDIQGISKNGILRYRGFQETFVIYDRIGNLTNDDRILKSLHRDSFFPRDKYLNIWVSNIFNEDITGSLIEAAGYSSFPWEIDPILDGVVINYKHLGLQPSSTKFGLGKSLIHEVGHWLGLYHTFEDSMQDCFENDCSNEGDRVCDTEPRQGGAWDGFTFPDTEEWTEYNCYSQESCVNGGTSTIAVQNYMDYNFHPCWKFFTQGQKERVKDYLYWYRYNIYSETNPPAGCTPGTVDDDDTGGGGYNPNDDNGEGYQPFATFHETGANANFNDNWIFTQHGKEIHIRKRVGCESEYHQILSVGSIDYEDIDSENEGYKRVTIINNNTFAVIASKNYQEGYFQEQRDILIYKNINDNWQLVQTIPLGIIYSHSRTHISYNVGKLAVNLIFPNHFTGNYTSFVNVYNLTNNTFELSTTFEITTPNENPKIGDLQIDIYGGIYVSNQGYSDIYPKAINYYRLRSTGQYLLIKTYTFGISAARMLIKKWVTRNGKLYVLHDIDYYLINGPEKFSVFEKVRTYPLRWSQSHTAWEKVEELNLYNTFSSPPHKTVNFDIYNDVYIFAVHRNGHHSLRFLKIREDGDSEHLALNLLGDIAYNLRKPCKAKYYNYGDPMFINKNDLLVSGRILYKLSQIIGETTTTHICSVPLVNETFGHNITIGENCSVSFNNSNKVFTASNEIIIKPNTTISNSNFIAKIQQDFSQCDFIDVGDRYSCSTSTSTAKNSYSYKLLNEQKDKIIEKVSKIYPNPNNGTFYINDIENIENIRLYNMMGQLIFDKKINDNNEVAVPDIKNGLYNLILYKKNGTKESTKIIINK